FDDPELKKLLSWVEKGNTLFLSAGSFSENLLDTLQLKTATRIPTGDLTSRPRFNLVNPDLKRSTNYIYEQEMPLVYFSKFDTQAHTILGVSELKDFNDPAAAFPNFLKADWGDGKILIHSIPQAFSNYFLLSGSGYQYAQDAMAYLDQNSPVYWDHYYKTGK